VVPALNALDQLVADAAARLREARLRADAEGRPLEPPTPYVPPPTSPSPRADRSPIPDRTPSRPRP
jgi:hypothetical protein